MTLGAVNFFIKISIFDQNGDLKKINFRRITILNSDVQYIVRLVSKISIF